ncbi:akap12 [Pungitius sinensis]
MLGTITLTVGQPDGVAQKEEVPEIMDTIQGDMAPEVNSEKVEKESPDANDISAVEEKAAEEKPQEANEVGFKKIFRFVGFKFTLKKDKSEEKDPVKLLTVKDKEEGEVDGVTDEPTKEEEAAPAEEKSSTEGKEADAEAPTDEAEAIEADKAETTDAPAENTAAEATDEVAEKEGETTMSPFRKLFSGGLFSNLRKKASIKKTKEEEDKVAAVEEETAKTEDTAAAVEEKEEKDNVEQQTNEETPTTPEEVKSASTPEPEVAVKAPAAATSEETKPEEEKAQTSAEEEKVPAEVTNEAELLSSQEKAKPQGSPLKKLFAGAGLKKLSTKKQKAKKDTETKITAEPAAEQLQSSTESAEDQKNDSGPASPEEMGQEVIAVEVTQNESSQETDGEVASDGEKKKDGIVAWSSFKKLVTPKKRVKRSSESEDEAAAEKTAKSATLSSSESAPLADKSVEEEAEEEKPAEDEPKTENTEKLASSTEEPKKKMDTSVSWEALMCMGGPKKRTRKTSDSDDEETKVEEESVAAALEGEQVGKTEAAIVSSQTTESDGEVGSSTEPERESTWDTLKRMVMPKNKAKAEEKPEDSTEQVQSDSEAPKDESTFSLRKLFPGRRKKKAEKQASTEQSEEDSDTPAVVPLSEYEDQVEPAQQAIQEKPAEVHVDVSTEDRSPSWIPAAVEDGDDKHEQLSDIPEEAENAATPKSVDIDIAEEESEDKDNLPLEVPKRTGRRLSTAEVTSFAPAPSAETTSVPKGPKADSAEEKMEGLQVEISQIPPQTSVTVEDVPVEVGSEQTEYEPPTENAKSKTHIILEPHAHNDAMAICTGLGTKEIAKVAFQKPVMPVVEAVAVINDGLTTELSLEDKPAIAEEAISREISICNAQLHQVDTTELEPVVAGSDDLITIQAAESHEPEIEMAVSVSTVQGEFEIIQPPTVNENLPGEVIRGDPITPTLEAAICTQSLQVAEPSVETKEVKMDVEQLAATEQNTVKEEVQCVSAEIVSTIDATEICVTNETEQTISVVEPSDVVVISQTVVLAAPVGAAASDLVARENTSEAVGEEPVQVQQTREEVEAQATVEAKSEIGAATEQPGQDVEAQSIAIAQAVIQDAVDKVSADAPEPEPEPERATSTPVQAVATIEEEMETGPVISDTPVVVVCEKPASNSPQLLHVAMEVIDQVAVDVVTESLDASVEEKKSAEGLLKAVEVKASEEIVVEEEVVEIKAENQAGEEKEQVDEEQSKEEAEVDEASVEKGAEEEEQQLEESKSEAPSEKNEVLEIHMPVQVVLQTAQVFEEPSVEEEVAQGFDCNGSLAEDTDVKSTATQSKLPTLSEEPQAAPSQDTEAPETPSGKCAEVMAQVIEVIEEAVKEIEPVSTEITAAS